MGKLLSLLTVVSVLALAGCASTGVAVQNADDQQLAPVQGGNVSTAALPPIGPNGEVTGPTDQTGVAPLQPGGTQVATADGTTAQDGTLPNSAGRELSGGLAVEKLLGRWTVVSGTDQCPINLTQTAKGSTGRYRASAPGCGIKSLAAVASWQLNGSQVQLYDDRGLIATLVLSGNRFIGTLSGGQGISMVG